MKEKYKLLFLLSIVVYIVMNTVNGILQVQALQPPVFQLMKQYICPV
ncbi:MAG: hypothetical protein MRZ88_03140 [Firmicutes bacterium]|nr:hypothetical protein [Bacillota bacterium]